MFKMLAVLGAFFIFLCLIILLSISGLIFFIHIAEKIISGIRCFRLFEKVESFVYRKRKDLNSNTIAKKIKGLWSLDEIYLVPIPLVNVRIRNTAFVSSSLFNKKLSRLK